MVHFQYKTTVEIKITHLSGVKNSSPYDTATFLIVSDFPLVKGDAFKIIDILNKHHQRIED